MNFERQRKLVSKAERSGNEIENEVTLVSRCMDFQKNSILKGFL